MANSALMSNAEAKVRVDLAAFYRLVAHFGMTDLIDTHISARLPGTADHFLINRYGVLFEEMRTKIKVVNRRDHETPLTTKQKVAKRLQAMMMTCRRRWKQEPTETLTNVRTMVMQVDEMVAKGLMSMLSQVVDRVITSQLETARSPPPVVVQAVSPSECDEVWYAKFGMAAGAVAGAAGVVGIQRCCRRRQTTKVMRDVGLQSQCTYLRNAERFKYLGARADYNEYEGRRIERERRHDD